MKYAIFVFVMLAFSLFSCTSDTATSERQAATLVQEEKVMMPTAKPIGETSKPAFTSMVQEEKPRIEIVDKTGKPQQIEITQPEIKATSATKKVDTKVTATLPKMEQATPSTKEKENLNIPAQNEVMPMTSINPNPTVNNQPKEIKKEPMPKTQVLSHTAWDKLLQKYVSSSGKVDYKGFQADKNALNAYTEYLAANPVQSDWSSAKQMAYWINAYNAFTVKLIVDNYPVSSITNLHGGKPWDKKWIELGSKTYSLNNIENDILRPQFKDARIHFAVNCAAKSCPPLLNEAWTATNLGTNFEKQAKSFINNSAYNTISEKKVQISKIFDWYASDFDNIIDYLNQYASVSINSKAKVTYREYDWALNE